MPCGKRNPSMVETVQYPVQSRRDAVSEARWGSDDAEVAMPEFDQMTRQVERTDPVVEADGRMRILPIELVGIDIWELARPQQVVGLGRMPLANQRNAVDAALDQSADQAYLLCLVIVTGGDKQLIAVFVQPS